MKTLLGVVVCVSLCCFHALVSNPRMRLNECVIFHICFHKLGDYCGLWDWDDIALLFCCVVVAGFYVRLNEVYYM